MNSEDLYGILGVSRSANDDEIKKAYRKLCLTHHPDKGGDASKFQTIQKAYEVLSDDKKREMYDSMGITDEDEMPNTGFGGGVDLASVFMNMMGGGGGFGFSFPGMGSMGGNMGGSGTMGSGLRKKPKGPSKLHEIPVSLHDFYHGKHLKIQFERQKFCDTCKGEGSTNVSSCNGCNGRGIVEQLVNLGPNMHAVSRSPCGNCSGSGKVPIGQCDKCKGKRFFNQEKVLDVFIEPGMKSGDTLTFQKECSDDINYLEAGDVHIKLCEADESINLERKNNDLYISCIISFSESILGTTYNLRNHPKYPNGYTIQIPKGVLNNEVIAIENEGMPKRNTKQFGSLYIKIEIKISQKEKSLLEEHNESLRKMFT